MGSAGIIVLKAENMATAVAPILTSGIDPELGESHVPTYSCFTQVSISNSAPAIF